MKEIHWLFFDVGSTLVNEEKAYKDRIEQAIADTNISYAAFYQTMNHYFKENKKRRCGSSERLWSEASVLEV